ncbi:MAG: cation:dicarboxylase symporter family transporter [Puniceicoccales bacterium]|jgi:Na+/H+-dicarboxylate symporter|nr:cation:dicarboxylase symporter family transporter [Puniceicoccales bacterium]
MRKKISFVLISLVVLALIGGEVLPLPVLRLFLAISVTLQSVIIFALPALIFCLIFSTFQRFGKNASRIFIVALILLCCSNFLATYVSHFIGEMIHGMELSLVQISANNELTPSFDFRLPKIIPNALAMVVAMICGIFVPKIAPIRAQKLSTIVDKFVSLFLKCIQFIVPFFLFGFLLKMQYDGIIMVLIRQYIVIVAIIVVAIVSYLLLFYFLVNGMNTKATFEAIKNMIPAVVCAFGTMSSASALPYTLIAVEKNSKNKDLAKSIVSITTNIHLIGDCIAIPIFIYAILKSYGVVQPSQFLYLGFVLQFVAAKFSVAAVPAGGIIVMLPIIERCFGFNGVMSSLILSLYILMDPICTSANVLGNGAFAQLIDRIATHLHGK